jgi:hypothetical protein
VSPKRHENLLRDNWHPVGFPVLGSRSENDCTDAFEFRKIALHLQSQLPLLAKSCLSKFIIVYQNNLGLDTK